MFFFLSFWKAFCTSKDSGQPRPIIQIKRSPLEEPQASQNQVTRLFSLLLIASSQPTPLPPLEKKVAQNIKMQYVKNIGSRFRKQKISGSGVFVLFATTSQCLSKVCSCFLKVFRFMLSRVTLSATNNKQHLTHKKENQPCVHTLKSLFVGLIQLSWDQIDLALMASGTNCYSSAVCLLQDLYVLSLCIST